jgi:phosphoribosylanthranilate isomerase
VIRVKICCIGSIEEASLAIRLGADALGLVSEMPSGPGVIPETLIAGIASSVPPPIATVLLTSLTDPHRIIAQQKRCGVNTVQICDRLTPGDYPVLRAAMPGVSLMQVIHVGGEESVAEAVEVASRVDALLLDSGNQELPVKELGGTGRTHDWVLSARIVEEAAVPVFLAGGLHGGNVGEAIRSVRPFGVDLCSGVRTGDVLDKSKLLAFMEAVEASH